ERAMGELIDTLVGRLGGDRVVRLEMRQTHVPEGVFRMSDGATKRRRGGVVGEMRARGASGDRPTLVFARPEPAQGMAGAPEGPPKWMRWRGEEHALVGAIGPERISEEWWGNDGATERRSGGETAQRDEGEGPPARDYFKVQ